jgi:hypothetical protein
MAIVATATAAVTVHQPARELATRSITTIDVGAECQRSNG